MSGDVKPTPWCPREGARLRLGAAPSPSKPTPPPRWPNPPGGVHGTRVRPSPCPQSLLAARRGVQDPRARRDGKGIRDARRRRDRPREHVRRRRVLPRGDGHGREADPGLRGLRGAQEPAHQGGDRRHQGGRLPPHPARRERDGLPQSHPPGHHRLPRRLLLQAAHRLASTTSRASTGRCSASTARA